MRIAQEGKIAAVRQRFSGSVRIPVNAKEALLEYGRRPGISLLQRAARIAASLAGIAVLTWATHSILRVNAPTAGFGYLVLILVIASEWGFAEALAASVAATLGFNYFFFPPIGALAIQDPQNWVALCSFLAASVIASRLSEIAKRRTLDAEARRKDVERLYALSRRILLIGGPEPCGAQLAHALADIFDLSGAAVYEPRNAEFYVAGSAVKGELLKEQLQQAYLKNSSFSDPRFERRVAAVRLGAEPIASLAIQGSRLADPVLRGIANLVAIGLERARAQHLEHELEAARQSEQLRTALIDAMAHEFKTPLTSIKAATTSLLAAPAQAEQERAELLRIADEAADDLGILIDDAVDMARLDAATIELALEPTDLTYVIDTLIAAMRTVIDDRPIEVACQSPPPLIRVDRRLVRLALKQLLDNALKYSPPDTSIRVRVSLKNGKARVDVANRGNAIPLNEQQRIFDRFYRGPAAKGRIPGSGLGLNIAQRIAKAHKGDLSVTSGPNETVFRLSLPAGNEEEPL